MDAPVGLEGRSQRGEDHGHSATLGERFDEQVSWAYRHGMVGRWEVFRCELQAALAPVCGLGGDDVDPDDSVAMIGLGQRHRDLELIVEQARAAADPAIDWDGCYDALWVLAGQVGLLDVAAGTPAPVGHADPSQHGEGIPDHGVRWLLRSMYLRDMAEVFRSAPIGNWRRLAPVLHRQLMGTWALETRWEHRSQAEHLELVAARRQQLWVLLATARQHLDPCLHWEAFREYLWLRRASVSARTPNGA